MNSAFRLRFLLGALALFVTAFALPARAQRSQHLTPSLVADTTTIVAGKPFTVGILYKIEPKWHIYWRHPGESGAAPSVKWQLPAGFTAGPIQWPLPETHFQDSFITNIYEGEVLLTAQITPPEKLPSGPVNLKANLTWFVCSQFCTRGNGSVELSLKSGANAEPANAELFDTWRERLPKEKGAPETKWDVSNPAEVKIAVNGVPSGKTVEFFPIPPEGVAPAPAKVADEASGAKVIAIEVEKPAPADSIWRGLLVLKDGEKREGWYVSQDGKTGVAALPAVAASATPVNEAESAKTVSTGSSTPPSKVDLEKRSLWSILLLAFVGGMILNVMPCVLPVIALKIFSFVKQSGEDRTRVFKLGLCFVTGIIVFFLGMATVAAGLHASGRSLNWGSQFQNPFILAGLICLIFVFGLNLLGVFEITLAGEATNTLSQLSSKAGYGGAFMHGLFTTLLGTSCSAPFLGVSIGYAVTQPPAIIFLLFFTIGIGMSTPYFLLTAFPAWLKFLPKPGVWMERFKQITGFIMLAVAIWLFSVLAGSRPLAATHLSWYLLALGVGCWLLGVWHKGFVRWLIFPLIIVGGYTGIVHGSLKAPLTTSASNLTQRIADARETGKPVFVDFTADWCPNCKAYEKAVLHTDQVQAAMAQKSVVTVIADWTNPDPEIEEWLKKFNRAAVPLYLLYKPGASEPIVMDALAPGSFLDLIGSLPEPAAKATVQR